MENEYQDVGKSAMQVFAEGMRNLTQAMRMMTEAFNSIAEFSPVSQAALDRFRPFRNYAAAGYPLGKSIRGLKKWNKRNANTV